MCLIIIHSRKVLSLKQFTGIWAGNPHGYGCIDAQGNVHKSMYLLEAFSTYRTVRPRVSHWRWRTHGAVDIENVHPFETDTHQVFHNGVLRGYGNETISDSRDYVAKNADWIDDAVRYEKTTAFVLFEKATRKIVYVGDEWHRKEHGLFSNYYAYDERDFVK